ncbi:hypothetical protein GTP91_12070, partial [Rugamonas sp. FT82W]|nr:hypothetical protein [Duganella vulcania]
MAANTISSSRISTPLDGVQAANQRETRVNRERQRGEQVAAQRGDLRGLQCQDLVGAQRLHL